jgi:sodium-dependent dicarboxylate transporter 2/3/5
MAAGTYFMILAMPLPDLSTQGKGALAVAGVAAFLWVTNATQPAVTGIVVLFLLPFTGVLSNENTYAYFGNHAVFLVLGAFILASPVMRSGLSARIALWAVSYFGRSTGTLITSILWIGALLSFVISEHAVAAMLFPIVLEIVQAVKIKPGSKFGVAAFLALVWGVVIGGTATVLGGARAPLAMGILESTTGEKIGFLEWTLWALPVALIMLTIAHLMLLYISRDAAVSLPEARQFLETRTQALGPVSQREKTTAGIMVVTIGLWIMMGDAWGLDTVALLGVLMVFALRVADWHEVEEDVNWGVFVMYGSAIALSAALRDTGAAEALAQRLLDANIESSALVLGIVVVLAMGVTEIMSNAASVAVLMPIALVIAESYGIGSTAMTLSVAVPAGLAFMIPVSTPAIAIVISVPYISTLDVLVRGVWLKALGLLVFLLIAFVYWPLFGLT